MINLSALKANVDLEIEASKKESPDTFRCGMLLAEIVSEALEQQIASDVVKVVRCKDCQHWDERRSDHIITVRLGNCEKPLGDYIYVDITTAENDFCSYGERRTSDE